MICIIINKILPAGVACICSAVPIKKEKIFSIAWNQPAQPHHVQVLMPESYNVIFRE